MEPHRNTICRFFARGFCKFGSRCRFSHNIPVGKRSYYHTRPHALVYSDEPSASSSSSSQILQDDRPSTSTRYATSSRASTPESSRMRQPRSGLHSPSREEEDSLGATSFPHTRASGRHAEKHTCGICLEDIKHGKIFGILVNCSHCFCMSCIRGWRMRKEFATCVKQSCPECRTVSEFVIPSKYWVKDDKKQEFVAGYKERVGKIDCKYFRRGAGWCKFQEKCLYRHKLSDGSDPDYSKLQRPRCHNRPLELSDIDSDEEDYFFAEYMQDFVSSLSYSSLSDDSEDDFSSLNDSDDDDDELTRLNLFVLMNVMCPI